MCVVFTSYLFSKVMTDVINIMAIHELIFSHEDIALMIVIDYYEVKLPYRSYLFILQPMSSYVTLGENNSVKMVCVDIILEICVWKFTNDK